jgi:hypothetical protein
MRKLALLLVAGIAACAADLERSDVRFASCSEDPQRTVLRIPEAVTRTPSTGYAETVKTGSTWERTGTIPQREVFRPVGTVFSMEGANRHEAYLVISADRIVGFYLPGEETFAPLPRPVPLPGRRGVRVERNSDRRFRHLDGWGNGGSPCGHPPYDVPIG